MVVLSPAKPDWNARYPPANITSMEDWGAAYEEWARRSDVYDFVKDYKLRAIASDIKELAREPIKYGLFKGQQRFISAGVARMLGVPEARYPEIELSWLGGKNPLETMIQIAYHQGSSEFGSSQQQNRLISMGYVPRIYEEYLRRVIQEEGEHGFQMAYWLAMESGSGSGWNLAEDLLARIANSEDPELQQPLVEFNPPVLTLPEMGFYFANQDRDGWSQLMSSRDNANVLYAGQMRFFLRQEGRHLGAGEQLIDATLDAGVIPIDMMVRMSLEWNARAYRLHGNPYNSGGASSAYQIGAKNPIFPLDSPKIKSFTIPHPEGKGGFIEIKVSPDMDPSNLNGYAMNTMRSILENINKRRSANLSPRQKSGLQAYLRRISGFVPHDKKQEVIEGGIPTAAISWRPEHLADPDTDPWPFMRGYCTDVFGYPIPREEYAEYRRLVEVTEGDRETVRELTRKKGWMSEFDPGSKLDIYKDGPVQPRGTDVQLYEFTVDGSNAPRFKTIMTAPQMLRSQKKPERTTSATPGRATLDELYSDIVGN